MRRCALVGVLLAMSAAAPAAAQPPVAATWAGIGYEICPEVKGYPCSYDGASLACSAVTLLEGRRPYQLPCATTLQGAVSPDLGRTTAGTLRYQDELATDYTIPVSIRAGRFEGTIGTEDGVVTVTGTLHPFAGLLRREDG